MFVAMLLGFLLLIYVGFRAIRAMRVEPPDGKWSQLEAAFGRKFRGLKVTG